MITPELAEDSGPIIRKIARLDGETISESNRFEKSKGNHARLSRLVAADVLPHLFRDLPKQPQSPPFLAELAAFPAALLVNGFSGS